MSHEHRSCASCGYSLRGLGAKSEDIRCPECGRVDTVVAEVPCPECGYDVRSQLSDNGAKCPECGQFATWSALFPKIASIGDVEPVWYWTSFAQIIVAPLLAWVAAFAAGLFRSSLPFLLIPLGVLAFNAFWAGLAIGPVARRRRPWLWARLTCAFLFLNVILFLTVGLLFVLVIERLLGI